MPEKDGLEMAQEIRKEYPSEAGFGPSLQQLRTLAYLFDLSAGGMP